jgi:hypothetical protein
MRRSRISRPSVVGKTLAWMMAYRDRVLARGFDFLYEEEPHPAVRVLGLN